MTSEPAFTPIRPNPYIVGTPVRDRSMFFGREAEFDLVRKRFTESGHGGLLVFCGERRSGKTSILFQILEGRLGPEFIPVLIDMQSMAVSNEIDFLHKLSREVLEALGSDAPPIAPPDFREGSNHSATFGEFIERVLAANPRKKLILLFDEYELFENKIDAGALNQDVLYVLANLIEQHSVFVVFTGSQHLEARRAEYWTILGKSLYKTISYLERGDALNLIRRPVAGRLRYDDDVVQRILRLTAGQAFYTQAICQSLVDHVNDAHENVAGAATLQAVIDALVENPLPQMIFLWDGLDRDEKLVMALLAENLPSEAAHATGQDLARSITKRDYPIELSRGQIATALEKLFQSEMLLRHDKTDPPGYAFRMDLWRLWIRRMHSVWQVMREEGLRIPRRMPARARWLGIGAAVLVVAALLAFVLPNRGRGRPPAAGDFPPPPAGGPSGTFGLHVEPADAVIQLGGRRIGLGSFTDRIAAGTDHRFRVTAAGYADTEIVAHVRPGEAKQVDVVLRALLGDLQVVTEPAGALVRVDGRARGRSPVLVRGLRVAHPAIVEASLGGFGVAQGSFVVAEGRATPVTLRLAIGTQDLLVTTDPPGAEVRIDRVVRGLSPVRVAALAFGTHGIVVSHDGYATADTTLMFVESVHQLDMRLRAGPPGVLVVLGDRPAQIYLNGVLVAENVQNSGPRELPAGTHTVHVVQVSGETIDQTLAIRSGERTTFDFSRGTVTRKSP